MVYNDESTNSEVRKREDFYGLLSCAQTQDFSFLYSSKFKLLKIYKLNKECPEFPELSDLTQVHAEYGNYPTWLKHLIQKFNLRADDYKSKQFIIHVFNFIDSHSSMSIADNSMMKQCILRVFEGKGVYQGTLGADLSENFNQLLPIADSTLDAASVVTVNSTVDAVVADDSQLWQLPLARAAAEKFNSFWDSLTNLEDRIRLIYLFLSLASSNGLGYGHGGADHEGKMSQIKCSMH